MRSCRERCVWNEAFLKWTIPELKGIINCETVRGKTEDCLLVNNACQQGCIIYFKNFPLTKHLQIALLVKEQKPLLFCEFCSQLLTTAQESSLYLGTYHYKVKSSKNCLRGDAN